MSEPDNYTPIGHTMTRSWLAIAAVAIAATLTACTSAVSGTISDSPPPANAAAQSQTTRQPTTATWGQTYTWPDGISVEMSQPTPYTPSSSAAVLSGSIQHAVAFTVIVTNKSHQVYDFNPFVMNGHAEFNGASADEITDIDNHIGDLSEVPIEPGSSHQYRLGYSVSSAHGTFQIDYTETIAGPQAVFTGKI